MVFSDDKGSTMTVYGNAKTTTSQSKFNGSSLYVVGAGDYVTAQVANNGLDLGTGDFTLEGWLYFTNVPQKPMLYTTTWSIQNNWNNGGDGRIWFHSTPTSFMISANAWASAWRHVAVVRYGTSFKLYVDGGQQASATSAATMGTSDGILTFGNGMGGYLQDWRVVKGTAIYMGAFTAPTSPFPSC